MKIGILYIVGGEKEKQNLKIALINFLVMGFISNFDTSFTAEIRKKKTLAPKLTDLWPLKCQN